MVSGSRCEGCPSPRVDLAVSNIVHLPDKHRLSTSEGETWLCHVPATMYVRKVSRMMEAAQRLLPAPKEKADE